MRRIILIITVFVITLSFGSLSAQEGMLTSEETLIGESSDFFIGLHTGIFDCNQTVKYPYNFGAIAQYNYIPDVSKKWFFGGELGVFYVSGKEDALDRKTKLALADITVYPGISFPISSKINPDDNAALRLKKLANSRRVRVGLGFTAVLPLLKKSEGHGVNIDGIKPGIGFSLRTSYDLPNRMTLFLNITRIGRDLDGFAYKSSTSLERSNGNKHDESYYYKIGFMWNFIKK